MDQKFGMGGKFIATCKKADGSIRWVEEFPNTVVNVGLEFALDVLFDSSVAKTAVWFVGPTDGTPTVAAADTMASHAGWVETTAYSETVRQVFVDVRSTRTVSNTASKATFSINASTTIGGAFIASTSTKKTTSGTLLCAAAFTGGDRSVAASDTLEIQYDFVAADLSS